MMGKIIKRYGNEFQWDYVCPYCKNLLFYLYDENERFIGIGLDKHLQCSDDKCKKTFKLGTRGFHETDLDLSKIKEDDG